MSEVWRTLGIVVFAFGIVAVAVSLGLLASYQYGKVESGKKQQVHTYRDDISILTDPETGCQYFRPAYSSSGAAFAPRISPDGKSIMGCNGGKP